MGMDVNMLACVRALAENRIQDAKKYAFCCCANDNTKKNESQVRRYKNLLLNGPNMIELPANLNGLLRMEDVSGFHAERYYLGKTQWDLFEKIKRGVAVTSTTSTISTLTMLSRPLLISTCLKLILLGTRS